jgi:hypothetical protein
MNVSTCKLKRVCKPNNNYLMSSIISHRDPLLNLIESVVSRLKMYKYWSFIKIRDFFK